MTDLIVQARTGSSRLPNKIIYNAINNKLFLEYFYERVRKSKNINRIIIATTTERKDDIIEDICIRNKWLYFRGKENDLVDRFYKCCLKFDVKTILRLTSDCPLADYRILDQMINKYNEEKYDYMDTFHYGEGDFSGFPDGFNPEIFNINCLKNAWENSKDNFEREHIAPFMHKNYKVNYFKIDVDKKYLDKIDIKKLHLSLDTKEDLYNLRKIILYFEKIGKKDEFSCNDVLDYLYKYNYLY